jgi:hypothetical protein
MCLTFQNLFLCQGTLLKIAQHHFARLRQVSGGGRGGAGVVEGTCSVMEEEEEACTG